MREYKGYIRSERVGSLVGEGRVEGEKNHATKVEKESGRVEERGASGERGRLKRRKAKQNRRWERWKRRKGGQKREGEGEEVEGGE